MTNQLLFRKGVRFLSATSNSFFRLAVLFAGSSQVGKDVGGGRLAVVMDRFFRCGFRIPHVVLFGEESGLDGKRANCSGFGRGARKRPCIRHGLAVCFSWAAFRDLNAVLMSGSKSGLRGERTYCGYPGVRTVFSSPENGPEIGSANFARCSAFELHSTFAHQSRPAEIWVKIGSRVAECGNDTAVLQHFSLLERSWRFVVPAGQEKPCNGSKNDSTVELSTNSVWAFLVYFVQF